MCIRDRDKHIRYKMCLPCNFHNETDSHAGIMVLSLIHISLVTMIPLKSLCLWGAVITMGIGMLFLAFTTKETAGMELDSEEAE